MPVPARRKSSSSVRRRRSHHALQSTALSVCPNCQKPVVTHQACLNCGMYRGRIVLSRERKNRRLLKKK